MDNDKLKQFLIPIFLLIITLIGSVYFLPKCIENVRGCLDARQQADQLNQEIEKKKGEVEDLKRKRAEEEEKERQRASSIAKQFYRPIMSGLDTEAVVAGEFSEILALIRANRIKVRSIKYDYDPSDDEFVKGASSKYYVARLNMEMIGDYSSYKNFLNEVYKHDHFLDIQSIQITPYRKNKRILLINFKLKLYAQK